MAEETRSAPVRWGRILPIVLTGVFLLAAAYTLAILLTDPRYASSRSQVDFVIYRDAAARWLSGGPFYHSEQVAGPYYTLSGHVLYPPVALVLFVPFVYLPAAVWWAIPLSIIGWRVVTLRPSPRAIAAIAACLAWPYTIQLVMSGNPAMWIVAAVALSTRWPAAGVLVFLKPSLFPFALFGIRTRSWWLALGGFAIVSLAFLPLWSQWLAAIVNARGPLSGPLYSIREVPMMLIPLVAWLGRRGRESRYVGALTM